MHSKSLPQFMFLSEILASTGLPEDPTENFLHVLLETLHQFHREFLPAVLSDFFRESFAFFSGNSSKRVSWNSVKGFSGKSSENCERIAQQIG